MKRLFPGFYQPSDDDLADLWRLAVLVPDANVLLGLYRYNEETRVAWFDLLEQLGDRLWLPNQVALEFHRNRLQTIVQQVELCRTARQALAQTTADLKGKLRALERYPFAKIGLDADSVAKKLTPILEEARQQLDEYDRDPQEFFEADPILQRIEKLFDGRIGNAFPPERLDEIHEEGVARYEHSIPPGYKDVQKGGVRQYGDLVLWFQMIDYATITQKPVVMITDDAKEDWWRKHGSRALGPRAELVQEMIQRAGVGFFMYTPESFLAEAQKRLGKAISPSVIEEVQEVEELASAQVSTNQKPLAQNISATVGRLWEADDLARLERYVASSDPDRLSTVRSYMTEQMNRISAEDIARIQAAINRSMWPQPRSAKPGGTPKPPKASKDQPGDGDVGKK